jgi:hypothetical protein
MASPGDPSDPTGASEGTFATAELTADDFERLSTAFRPSWELDVAPFTGPASLSPSDIRALHGGEVHADVRATIASARSANGSHPPPKPTVTSEPAQSVIVESGFAAPAAPAHASAPPRPVPVAIEFPSVGQSPPAHAPRSVPPAPMTAVARPRLPSIDIGDSPFGRRSKTPLWIGLGIAVAAIAGLVLWSTSGTSTPDAAPAGSASAAAVSTSAAAAPSPEPPPPEPPPPPPAPPASAVMPNPIVMAPAPAPTRSPIVQAVPKPAPAAAPKPAAKPKAAGTTIVRDVPF